MNAFREIQPTQSIMPLKKVQDATKDKQQKKKPKEESIKDQKENNDQKIDEYI